MSSHLFLLPLYLLQFLLLFLRKQFQMSLSAQSVLLLSELVLLLLYVLLSLQMVLLHLLPALLLLQAGILLVTDSLFQA